MTTPMMNENTKNAAWTVTDENVAWTITDENVAWTTDVNVTNL